MEMGETVQVKMLEANFEVVYLTELLVSNTLVVDQDYLNKCNHPPVVGDRQSTLSLGTSSPQLWQQVVVVFCRQERGGEMYNEHRRPLVRVRN